MTVDDWNRLALYRNKRGPLNPMLRMEAGFALLATLLIRVNGGRAEMADFMPWAKDDSPPELGDVMNMLTGGKRG